jgi:hypothetical protein
MRMGGLGGGRAPPLLLLLVHAGRWPDALAGRPQLGRVGGGWGGWGVGGVSGKVLERESQERTECEKGGTAGLR